MEIFYWIMKKGKAKIESEYVTMEWLDLQLSFTYYCLLNMWNPIYSFGFICWSYYWFEAEKDYITFLSMILKNGDKIYLKEEFDYCCFNEFIFLTITIKNLKWFSNNQLFWKWKIIWQTNKYGLKEKVIVQCLLRPV